MHLGSPGRNRKIFNQSWCCSALCKGEVRSVTRRNHHHISEREGQSQHKSGWIQSEDQVLIF